MKQESTQIKCSISCGLSLSIVACRQDMEASIGSSEMSIQSWGHGLHLKNVASVLVISNKVETGNTDG